MSKNLKASDEVRAYMREIASARTPAKVAASRRNAATAAAARRRDPLTLDCTCEGGNSLEADAHKTTCPRGRLLHQRARLAARRARPQEPSAWSDAALRAAAERLAPIYEKSLREGGELTACTSAPGDFYEPADYFPAPADVKGDQ